MRLLRLVLLGLTLATAVNALRVDIGPKGMEEKRQLSQILSKKKVSREVVTEPELA